MRLSFQPMCTEFAREIVGWRYDEPYVLYNLDTKDIEDVVHKFTEPSNRHFAVTDERGHLVAFRCFGAEARVAGGDYSEDALDTGGGLRPDLAGQGLGLPVLHAGLFFGAQQYCPSAFRATVAAFNRRALRVCDRAGFREFRRFNRPADGREFTLLIRDG